MRIINSAIKPDGVLQTNGKSVGWIVGWIEENSHPYFFALNIEGVPNVNIIEARLNILKSILKDQGFFEGKK